MYWQASACVALLDFLQLSHMFHMSHMLAAGTCGTSMKANLSWCLLSLCVNPPVLQLPDLWEHNHCECPCRRSLATSCVLIKTVCWQLQLDMPTKAEYEALDHCLIAIYAHTAERGERLQATLVVETRSYLAAAR